MVVYSPLRPHDVELSICAESPRWGWRPFLKEMYRYPFDEMGTHRITVHVDYDNNKAIKAALGCGFVHEGTLRQVRHGKDVHIYGMLREDCRWL